MAPTNGPAKPRRPGANKQTPRHVVPAIPLPFVKRQAANSISAKNTTKNPLVATDSKLTNGHAKGGAKAAAPVAAINVEGAGSQDSEPVADVKEGVKPTVNGHKPSDVSKPTTSSTNEPQQTEKSAEQPNAAHKKDTGHSEALSTQEPADATERPGATAPNEMKTQLVDHQSGQLPKARQPQPISPNGYHMPPPFQPLNMPVNGDLHRGPGPRPLVPNGHSHMHQPHPSNGTVHFGAFHDSTSSSPAPPLSGGIAPPPGMPLPDGRPPYMGHGGNGFPPAMPYGADMMPPVTTMDNFGRPTMAYGMVDSFHAYSNSFGQSTPQAPNHHDDAMYNPYAAASMRNGAVGGPGDSQSSAHPGQNFNAGPDYPRMMQNHGPPPPMITHGDDGLTEYFQRYFASSELSDCILELRYADDRAAPVRIPSHRIILARSTELREQAVRPIDGLQQIILLQTKNRWIRSDAFYIAIQRLYGIPLFQIPPGFKLSESMDANSVADRFDFALSYAAAGYLLGWESIVRRGCDIAIQLLSWQTMERALEFALEEHRDEGSHDEYKYGDGSRALLDAIANYIIYNLPPNFTIDSSLSDPVRYARLPPHPLQNQNPLPKKSISPPIARGTSVDLGKGARRSQQISGIQFGDLSLNEGKNGAAETPKASQQPRTASYSVLSSVLLNLPFSHLKMVLESPVNGHINAWATYDYRCRIVKDAIAEREVRRMRALEAVKAGRVAGADFIRKQLSSPQPRSSDKWNTLGWQEEMDSYSRSHSSCLVRRWVPLVEAHDVPHAEYP